MSDLESLTARANDLSTKVDFWNNAVVWALAITALAAVAIFVSQRVAFVRAKNLSDVQEKIAKIKESEANEKVTRLQKDASDAKAAQQHVEIDLAKQKERTANAEKSLLLLRKEASARRLSGERQAKLANMLKLKIPGVIVIVSAVIDGESSDFANDFKDAFEAAGWKVVRYGNRITTDRGVQLGTVSGTADGGEVEEIGKILAGAGIETTKTVFGADDRSTSPNFEKGVLYLVVNHKPEIKTGQTSE